MRTRELNYPGLIDPNRDTVLGPDMAGRLYKVVGSIYDTETDKTTVTIEELTEDELRALVEAQQARI
jgi:hypothetical protein